MERTNNKDMSEVKRLECLIDRVNDIDLKTRDPYLMSALRQIEIFKYLLENETAPHKVEFYSQQIKWLEEQVIKMRSGI